MQLNGSQITDLVFTIFSRKEKTKKEVAEEISQAGNGWVKTSVGLLSGEQILCKNERTG